jgi:two-component system, cell cycle sensor histidine kinase and response regulator CckA
VDAGQIGQVVLNLMLNARRAMPESGAISVRAENVVLGPQESPVLPPGDYVRVSIADRGSGISKELLPKIFDPYFSTKERGSQKGMGLGLTICHSIIQRHGGAIAVESKLGVGTTFCIHLPARRR